MCSIFRSSKYYEGSYCEWANENYQLWDGRIREIEIMMERLIHTNIICNFEDVDLKVIKEMDNKQINFLSQEEQNFHMKSHATWVACRTNVQKFSIILRS